MRRPLLLVVISLVACGTRSGASTDSLLDDATLDGADGATCRPLAEYCSGGGVDCGSMKTYGSFDCARFKSGHLARCGSQPAYLVGFGIDTTLYYAYDPATLERVGVYSDVSTMTSCWGVVSGSCGATGPELCPSGGADASTGG